MLFDKKLSDISKFIDKFSYGDGLHGSPIEGVHFFKMSQPNDKLPVIYRPSIYLVAQGNKKVMLADEVFTYDKNKFLLVSVDLPIIGQITEATPEEPYLCVQIDIDTQKIRDLALRLNIEHTELAGTEKAIFVGDADETLKDVVIRLLSLLDNPQDIAYLAPLIIEEFYYRLLVGPYGRFIIKSCIIGSCTQRIAKVISVIKSDIVNAKAVDELAGIANMSISNFHRQFKQVTALSPLQYIKRLRLTKARQLMLSNNIDVSSAARLVGYESPSQFSRDYSKLFSLSPKKDITKTKRF